MRLGMFAIFDRKVEAFLPPFTSFNEATAEREVVMAVKASPKMAEFAQDYTLFKLGEFEDQTGEVFPLEITQQVGDVVNYVDVSEVVPLEGVA